MPDAARARPALAAHADWSVDPGKRWITVARPALPGWHVAAPEPVGDLPTLIPRLIARAGGGAVALGIDLPIGLPRAYGETHGAAASADFPGFLRSLPDRPDFFRVAETIDEVQPGRPFYPRRPGGARLRALSERLGIATQAGLWRQCERATRSRPAAAPLFWTIGAKQVGKAALSAWSEVLPAAMARGQLALWPFEGRLHDLLAPNRVVICETYPAESLRQLGVTLAGSKRRQSDRAALAPRFIALLNELDAHAADDLRHAIADGFGNDATGEDRMDSFVGLLGLLSVLADPRRDTVPAEPWITRWEGWILGQSADGAG